MKATSIEISAMPYRIWRMCQSLSPMKHLIARHQHTISEFVKFTLVGLLNTGIDVAVFFLLTWLGIAYVLAQVVSYTCGAGNSYLLNKVWTFRSCGLSYAEMVRFVVVNM